MTGALGLNIPVASGHEPPDVGEKPCWVCDDNGTVLITSIKDVNGAIHELPWSRNEASMPCPVCRLGMALET